jgi:hypothetical protein
MSHEPRDNMDVIADALESIADALQEIEQHLAHLLMAKPPKEDDDRLFFMDER